MHGFVAKGAWTRVSTGITQVWLRSAGRQLVRRDLVLTSACLQELTPTQEHRGAGLVYRHAPRKPNDDVGIPQFQSIDYCVNVYYMVYHSVCSLHLCFSQR